MSGSDLPDDPRTWPTNPFELLGVPYGAADADIKRAYTRLIRRFKPEHHAEQFRLIREAYEACLRQASWFRVDADAEPEPAPIVVPRDRPTASRSENIEPKRVTPPADEVPIPPPSADPDEAALGSKPEASQPAPESDFGADDASEDERPIPPWRAADRTLQLWALAVGGAEAEAYAGLVEQSRYEPDRVDVPLRLYWLSALNPSLDPTRTRHHWLADALARSNLRGPAVELYRRELETNPDQALYGPYDRLLSVPAVPRDLLTLARCRIVVAGREGRGGAIKSDLAAVKDRVRDYSDSEWLGLVVAAADWGVWTPGGVVEEVCRTELAGLKYLELNHGGLFDRVEDGQAVAAAVLKSKSLPLELVAVVRAFWAGSAVPGRRVMDAAISVIESDPARYLFMFDYVLRESGETVIRLLTRALERYLAGSDTSDETDYPADLIRARARHVRVSGETRSGWFQKQFSERATVLKLLVADAIDPAEFANACFGDPDPRYRALSELVGGDPSLRAVWLAQMAAKV
ncbi:J domain-containing protein [Fimbriiglobus ruber]|uniref:J domain-containing protein n=1 Tax=Fimbriiglobus ruber TaxID=1908690 RepID=A0A225EG31_9BACT|nr:hypothetical protein [Fimbriiglobus ruber]OWK47295.1 hypothetical protein FRUB_00994 [Fimbriiglobus ruber]